MTECQRHRLQTALISTSGSGEHGAPSHIGLLRGVSPELARYYHPGLNHSIRDLALHIAFWQNSLANKLSGTSHRAPFEQRKTGTPKRAPALSEQQWNGELKWVKETHQRLLDALAAFDPDRLDEPLNPRSPRRAIESIHSMAEHTIYHTAQLKLVKLLAKEAGVA